LGCGNEGLMECRYQKGEKNLITDVDGVRVGQVTLSSGDIQTGVTAVLPHAGNPFREKLPAATTVINGFGKSAGLVQIGELGTLETPVVLTNTLSVGTAFTALVRYMLERCPEICTRTGSVNPVVLECNDSVLNDIRGLHVQERHVLEALELAGDSFEEGAVGAGRGMVCYGMKGGIGSASRIVGLEEGEFTIGALVLTNHGAPGDFIPPFAGAGGREEPDRGSVIVILATDLPLSDRQLGRLSRRAVIGLARTGSTIGHGSGEIVLAFSTANRIPDQSKTSIRRVSCLHEPALDAVFRPAEEAVTDAVYSSLVHAVTVTGAGGRTVRCLRDLWDGAATNR